MLLQTPQLDLRGLLLREGEGMGKEGKGREGEERVRKGWEGKGREGQREGRGEGGEGKGGDGNGRGRGGSFARPLLGCFRRLCATPSLSSIIQYWSGTHSDRQYLHSATDTVSLHSVWKKKVPLYFLP